jgi:hypothetical protein
MVLTLEMIIDKLRVPQESKEELGWKRNWEHRKPF